MTTNEAEAAYLSSKQKACRDRMDAGKLPKPEGEILESTLGALAAGVRDGSFGVEVVSFTARVLTETMHEIDEGLHLDGTSG